MNHGLEKINAQEAEESTSEQPSVNCDEKIKPEEASPRSSSSSPARPAGSVDEKEKEKEKDVEAVKVTTNASSTAPAPIKVPRSKRRGLFGRFSIVAEVEEPRHYSRKTKWYITFVISMAAVAAPLGSTIILCANSQPLLFIERDADRVVVAALPDVAKELNTTATVTNLSVAFYMLSMSIFPLWWSSFSESLGRRTIYLTSFALFLLWNILAAVSTNIAMLIVMRSLGGGAAASVQAVGAGTMADIWEVRERGRAMGVFYLGPLCGPLLAPIIGGALAQRLGWRSTQWFLAGYGGVVLVLLFFALPETLKATEPVLVEPENITLAASSTPALSWTSSRQMMHRKTKKGIKIAKRILIDPLKIILYLRFPAVLITVYYASITFGTLYMLNISVETTFSKPPYNFSTIIVGLTYIPNSVGYLLTSVFGGKWTDTIMAREAKRAGRYDAKGRLIYRPEDRMRENAWIAAFLYPGALVWYGWTSQKGVFWVAPVSSPP